MINKFKKADKRLQHGQAAILIIFVIGMVSLLIGMSLSKTGFQESMMGRRIAGSTKAFYVANSGVEDAFYKIQNLDWGNSEERKYTLDVDEGKAVIKISGTKDQREIESIGKYNNFVRKIHVSAYNTEIQPGFMRAIQAGQGGVELEGNTLVTGRNKKTGEWYAGDVYSNTFVKGVNNGKAGECGQSSAETRVNGNVWAVESIGRLAVNDDGPCIDHNAYAGQLLNCRVFGSAYSEGPISSIDCPYATVCDPATDPVNCLTPQEELLPDIGDVLIKKHLENLQAKKPDTTYNGNCVIGGTNDCSKTEDYGSVIGNQIINGDLTTTKDFYISGPVWVKGNFYMTSNQTIKLAPDMAEKSLVILVGGRIISSSNVTFTSEDIAFLLFASEHINSGGSCEEEDDAAIQISSNVNSILFYAMKGCALVETTAHSEFYGAIVGEGVKVKTNSKVVYDPSLRDAKFVLTKEGGWQISSFTER